MSFLFKRNFNSDFFGTLFPEGLLNFAFIITTELYQFVQILTMTVVLLQANCRAESIKVQFVFFIQKQTTTTPTTNKQTNKHNNKTRGEITKVFPVSTKTSTVVHFQTSNLSYQDSLLVERRTRARKVASSNPVRSGRGIFFPHV